jgi:hypothetical protein
MDRNEIGEEGGVLLGQMLRLNKSLVSVSVKDNKVCECVGRKSRRRKREIGGRPRLTAFSPPALMLLFLIFFFLFYFLLFFFGCFFFFFFFSASAGQRSGNEPRRGAPREPPHPTPQPLPQHGGHQGRVRTLLLSLNLSSLLLSPSQRHLAHTGPHLQPRSESERVAADRAAPAREQCVFQCD